MPDFRRPFRARPIRKRPANVLQFDAHHPASKDKQRKAWWKNNWPYALLAIAPVLGVGIAWFWLGAPDGIVAEGSGDNEQYRDSFSRCSRPIRVTCVVDGDTIWFRGQKIRIADINTPEVGTPQCAAERALAERATNRLVTLLNAGGFSLMPIDRDEDRFGRKLRIVTRGGNSLGSKLVAEGLAETWTGSRRSWC